MLTAQPTHGLLHLPFHHYGLHLLSVHDPFFGRKLLQLLSFPLGISSVISYGRVKGKLIIGPHSQHVQAYVLHIECL